MPALPLNLTHGSVHLLHHLTLVDGILDLLSGEFEVELVTHDASLSPSVGSRHRASASFLLLRMSSCTLGNILA